VQAACRLGLRSDARFGKGTACPEAIQPAQVRIRSPCPVCIPVAYLHVQSHLIVNRHEFGPYDEQIFPASLDQKKPKTWEKSSVWTRRKEFLEQKYSVRTGNIP
jgi:hypothetical protein